MGCALSRDRGHSAGGLPGLGAAPPAGPARCKLVLLGDTGVGKSCIVQRQCRGTFNPGSAVTVGAAFLAHTLTTPAGVPVKFEIWDTAGQERFEALAPLYYRGASAAAVVYDVSSQRSFQRARHWIGELRRNRGDSAVLVMVGNKADLPAEERAVRQEEAAALAESNAHAVDRNIGKDGRKRGGSLSDDC